MLALTNGVFYTGESIVNDKALLIDDDLIVGFVDEKELINHENIVDLKGAAASPGYLDIQINGCCDELFTPETPVKTLMNSASVFSKYGTTRWMPTYLSLSIEDLQNLNAIIEKIAKVSGILGLHIEGPWIDKNYKGVHPESRIRKWTDLDYMLIKKLSQKLLTCITLSPNKIEKKQLVQLSQLEMVKLLLGHSEVSYEISKEYFDLGITGVTHILNAMRQPTSREPSIVSAVMENDNIYANVIADMYHIHPAMIKMLKRAFYRKSLFFVSDAMPTVGGNSKYFSILDNKCHIKNGKITDENNNLAGSSIMIVDAIRNSIQYVGIPMDEALRMATIYPASFLGIDKEYGLLKTGYKADITVFTNQMRIIKTFRSGKLVYDQYAI